MPHDIPRASKKRRVVIIGAGPGGLEAARVSAERGHEVLVLEAMSDAGGQVRLAAQSKRRREMLAIIDWRLAQCEKLGVEVRYNHWAEADDILAEHPDVVIVATGGYPIEDQPAVGNALVVSSWDILTGHIKPGKNVLLFDDAGDHPALQAAEVIAATGAALEIMTPDRTFSAEIMAMNLVPYMRALQRPNVTFTPTYRLKSVEQSNDGLLARITSDYLDLDHERRVDQVVVNYGVTPMADIYFDLKPQSSNGGEVDYDDLIVGDPQSVVRHEPGRFQLFRIGDAVESRNTHAAIYDALRLAKDL
jgi:NADPH-dependent 2,4-dienoyl-CoA reductase/sulfur reductase-like enzyme